MEVDSKEEWKDGRIVGWQDGMSLLGFCRIICLVHSRPHEVPCASPIILPSFHSSLRVAAATAQISLQEMDEFEIEIGRKTEERRLFIGPRIPHLAHATCPYAAGATVAGAAKAVRVQGPAHRVQIAFHRAKVNAATEVTVMSRRVILPLKTVHRAQTQATNRKITRKRIPNHH